MNDYKTEIGWTIALLTLILGLPAYYWARQKLADYIQRRNAPPIRYKGRSTK